MQSLFRQPIEWWLKRSLSLLLFLLPFPTIWITEERFLNGAKWEYGTLGIYGTEILIGATAILFIIWYWKKFRLKFSVFNFQFSKDRLFAFACLSFILYLFLSSLWARDPNLALQHARYVMEAFILFFMLWLGPLTFKKAATAFVAGAILQSLLGIYQFLTQSTFSLKWLGIVAHPAWQAGASIIAGPEIGRWLRAYGAFPHPNIFGGYLIVGLALTSLLLYKVNLTNRASQIKFCILQSAVCIQIAALFFTFSRAAWLAFIIWITICLTSLFVKRRGDKVNEQLSPISYFLFPISLFLILTAIFLPLVKTRLSQSTSNEIRSTDERLSGYQEAWQLFKQHPFLGVGAGNYTRQLIEDKPSLSGWSYQPAHSVPLLILAELGLLGKALLIILVTTFFLFLRSQNLFYKPRTLVLLATYCLLAMFDHYLYSSLSGLLIGESFFGLILLSERDQ